MREEKSVLLAGGDTALRNAIKNADHAENQVTQRLVVGIIGRMKRGIRVMKIYSAIFVRNMDILEPIAKERILVEVLLRETSEPTKTGGNGW